MDPPDKCKHAGHQPDDERVHDRYANLTSASAAAFFMRGIRRLALWFTSRMGSFSSAPRIPNEDMADSDLINLPSSTWEEILERCQMELEHWPNLIHRRFVTCPRKLSQLSVKGRAEIDPSTKEPSTVRIFQWNILAEALGKVCSNDNFVACPEGALDWKLRRWRLLEEIVSVKPDILCLQEVDHFRFLESTLGSLGFKGVFCPKPDSPCIYVVGNNGPDGCAIFWNDREWELVRSHDRSLEVWGYSSNQVAIMTVLKRRRKNISNGSIMIRDTEETRKLAVATTHLKARQGDLLSTLRQEQGKDLLNWIHDHCPKDCPLVLSGDFNAEPTEPVYGSVLADPILKLDSSYASEVSLDGERVNGNINPKNIAKLEPPYTTWKIREDGEHCHTIDYVFYSKNYLTPKRILAFPTEEDVGPGRVPSYQYPSDHFSLVTDFEFSSDLSSHM